MPSGPPDDPGERNYLRQQLLRRFEAHAPSSWPVDLLAAVIAVIDLRFGEPPGCTAVKPTPKPGLHLVGKSSPRNSKERN
jgi:hypothetical protein